MSEITTLSQVEDMVNALAETGVNLDKYKFVGRFPHSGQFFQGIRIDRNDEPLHMELIVPDWLIK